MQKIPSVKTGIAAHIVYRTTICDIANREWWNGIAGVFLSIFMKKDCREGIRKYKINARRSFCWTGSLATTGNVSESYASVSVKCSALDENSQKIFAGERESYCPFQLPESISS